MGLSLALGGVVEVVIDADIPLPLDHFFFCFLPPVGAGAWGMCQREEGRRRGTQGGTHHFCGSKEVWMIQRQ